MKTAPAPETTNLTEMRIVRPAKISKFYETEIGCVPEAAQETELTFRSMTAAQKRFHLIFYTLASLTGLVIVQVIWQVAVATAK